MVKVVPLGRSTKELVDWDKGVKRDEGKRGKTVDAFVCPICFTDVEEGRECSVAGGCGHRVCSVCASLYFSHSIRSRQVPIKCLQTQCPQTFQPREVELFVTENLYAQYERFLVMSALTSDPDLRFCPTPDCNYVVIGHFQEPVIDCPCCNQKFCYTCGRHWTEDHECSAAIPEGLTVKACPQCRTLIEKVADQSCNHMICSNCSCDFCWLCGEKITEFQHFWTVTGCTYYGKKKWKRSKEIAVTIGVLLTGPVLLTATAILVVPYIAVGLPLQAVSMAKKEGKSKLYAIGVAVGAATISPLCAALCIALGIPFGLGAIYLYIPSRVIRMIFKKKQPKTSC